MVAAMLMGTSGWVWSLDVADVTREWTADGKKIAAERAKLPAHDEMVKIPAGTFLMGSDKKVDRNAYQPEFSEECTWMPTKSTNMKSPPCNF
jgi:iron(II)-dependent oxidoreductase